MSRHVATPTSYPSNTREAATMRQREAHRQVRWCSWREGGPMCQCGAWLRLSPVMRGEERQRAVQPAWDAPTAPLPVYQIAPLLTAGQEERAARVCGDL